MGSSTMLSRRWRLNFDGDCESLGDTPLTKLKAPSINSLRRGLEDSLKAAVLAEGGLELREHGTWTPS